MPIRLIAHQEAFTPEEIEILISAFEETLSYLTWVKREDEVALLIAKQIIAVARQGCVILKCCALRASPN